MAPYWYGGKHREFIQMVPEKMSELPETLRRSHFLDDAVQDVIERHEDGHRIAISTLLHLICYQVAQLGVDLERVPDVRLPAQGVDPSGLENRTSRVSLPPAAPP